MRRDLVTSVVGVLVISALFGAGYPLLVTGAAQVAFNGRANGSLIHQNGRLVGSHLLAQDFRRDTRYFQPRPSTATGYAADATAFTNLGPNDKNARTTFAHNLASYLRLERNYSPGLAAPQVPIDAVTSSASGVDPHISRANAAIQARRVAAVRHLPLPLVRRLVARETDGRFLGVLGEPGVNVLELNLALDRIRA